MHRRQANCLLTQSYRPASERKWLEIQILEGILQTCRIPHAFWQGWWLKFKRQYVGGRGQAAFTVSVCTITISLPFFSFRRERLTSMMGRDAAGEASPWSLFQHSVRISLQITRLMWRAGPGTLNQSTPWTDMAIPLISSEKQPMTSAWHFLWTLRWLIFV